MPHLLRPFQRLLVVDATAEVPDHLQKHSSEVVSMPSRQHVACVSWDAAIGGLALVWRLATEAKEHLAESIVYALQQAIGVIVDHLPASLQDLLLLQAVGNFLPTWGSSADADWRQLSKHHLQQQPCQNSSPAASRRQWSSNGSRSLIGGCPLGACCPVVPHPLDLFECQAMPSIG